MKSLQNKIQVMQGAAAGLKVGRRMSKEKTQEKASKFSEELVSLAARYGVKINYLEVNINGITYEM